jgi:formiminoglutamase
MPNEHDWMFDLTTRPLGALFFTTNKTSDPRMGALVRHEPAEYAAAEVVLLGCPQDEGVRRNGGRIGAAAAPDAIRERLYRLVALEGLRMFDLGNTLTTGSLEEILARQRQLVAQIVRDGKQVVSLGGGNDLAYADCAGLAAALPDAAIMACNIDTHFDVREDIPCNSGTPYRMLLEEGLLQGQHLYELGHQAFAVAASHREYLAAAGAQVFSLAEWRRIGIDALLRQILVVAGNPAIFWGLDIDAVRAADAPGCSAPNPTGLSAEEFCEVARLAGADPRSRVFEISEVNPSYDIDMRTCRLAAIAVWEFLRASM